MIDHSSPLQVQGRVGDRMTEVQARRLAAEARAGSRRTHSLTAELRAAAHSGAALWTRLRHVRRQPAPRLAAGQYRA
jgi:hypothetical protein